IIDTLFVAQLPALIDLPGLQQPAGSRSFFTLDNGKSFGRVDKIFPSFGIRPGSWLIRAVVEVSGLPAVITRAFYRKGKLQIIGRNFTNNTIVRINDKRVKLKINFVNDGKL